MVQTRSIGNSTKASPRTSKKLRITPKCKESSNADESYDDDFIIPDEDGDRLPIEPEGAHESESCC